MIFKIGGSTPEHTEIAKDARTAFIPALSPITLRVLGVLEAAYSNGRYVPILEFSIIKN